MEKEDEMRIDTLFRATHSEVALNFMEFSIRNWGEQDIAKYRTYAERLTAFGLVDYTDTDKTRICLTEKGERIGKESSYIQYSAKEAESMQKEEIKEAVRTELDRVNLLLARRQLKTFWLTMLVAIVSLIISIIALLK
jgi:hypothetical protein